VSWSTPSSVTDAAQVLLRPVLAGGKGGSWSFATRTWARSRWAMSSPPAGRRRAYRPEPGWSSRPARTRWPLSGRVGKRWRATRGAVPPLRGRSAVGPPRHAPLMHQTASQPVEALPAYAIQRHLRPLCCRRDTKPGDPVPRRADRHSALRDQGVAGSNPVSPTIYCPVIPQESRGFSFGGVARSAPPVHQASTAVEAPRHCPRIGALASCRNQALSNGHQKVRT
jgi:hypothetical protein